MPRLTRAQQQARERIIRLAGSGLSPVPLGQAIVRALTEAIPAEVQTLFGVDPDSLLYNRAFAASAGYAETRLKWLRDVYLVDQPGDFNHPGMMRARLSAAAINDRLDACWGFPAAMRMRLSEREWQRKYHAHPTPAGGVLMGSFAMGGQAVGALNLARLDARRPFQLTDVAFLHLVGPTIGRAIAAALARERAVCGDGMGDTSGAGVLLVDARGHVRFATTAAEMWVGRLRETWQPEAPGKVQLPIAVWAVIARARAGDACRAIVRVPLSTGMLRIEAAPGSEPDVVAVVMMPERPPALPSLPMDWPLTLREREVLALVVHGRSNRQIADTLCVTENTLETHLAHAYDKLGVHSRAEVFARLFRTTYLPTLLSEEPSEDRPLILSEVAHATDITRSGF